MKISDSLKKHRKENHLTQDYVAEKLNVSRKTISSWENGRSTPNYVSLLELAKIFHIEVTDLVSEKDLSRMELTENSFRGKLISIKRNGYISKYAFFFDAILLIIGLCLFVLPFNINFLWMVPLFAIDLSVIILYEKNWKTVTSDKPLVAKLIIVSIILFISLLVMGILNNLNAISSDHWIIIAILIYTATITAALIIAILFPLKRTTVRRKM